MTFPEIEEFLFKKKGVDLQEEALGYQRVNITSFQEFLITLQVKSYSVLFLFRGRQVGSICGYKNVTCDALPDLVPLVQFKKLEKHPWRIVTFSKVAG